ncbi:hypothetical protein LJR296_001422 [Cupriavidus necator]|uniref:hypothetical protein n=1 Tax=Cupriavidus necator TaxID=106590 RepID=UPI003ED0E5EB
MLDNEMMLMARAPYTHPLGKLTHESRTLLPECVGEKLVQTAASLGMTEAELTRDILCQWGFGDRLNKIAEERRRITAINPAEIRGQSE